MNYRDNTTKYLFQPIVALLLILFAGCKILGVTDSIYNHQVKKTADEEIIVSVSSRLEHKGIEKSVLLSQKACNDENKLRVLTLKQSSSYIPQGKSEYETPYYKTVTIIKCK